MKNSFKKIFLNTQFGTFFYRVKKKMVALSRKYYKDKNEKNMKMFVSNYSCKKILH